MEKSIVKFQDSYTKIDWNLICGLHKQLFSEKALKDLHALCDKYDAPYPKWQFLRVRNGKELYNYGNLVSTLTMKTITIYLQNVPDDKCDTFVFKFLSIEDNKKLGIERYFPEMKVPKLEDYTFPDEKPIDAQIYMANIQDNADTAKKFIDIRDVADNIDRIVQKLKWQELCISYLEHAQKVNKLLCIYAVCIWGSSINMIEVIDITADTLTTKKMASMLGATKNKKIAYILLKKWGIDGINFLIIEAILKNPLLGEKFISDYLSLGNSSK